MEQGVAIRQAVHRLTRLVRLRRAAFYGTRGLVWGLLLAVVPVLLRAFLEGWAWIVAGGLAGAGLLVGMLVGVFRRVPAEDAASLADRTFGLHDRLRTALELSRRPAAQPAAPLETAAVADAAARAGGLDLRKAVPWRWPRETAFIPVPVLVLVGLPYLPPVPVPQMRVPTFTPAAEEEKVEKTASPQAVERPAAKKSEPVQKVEVQEKDYPQRQNPDREQSKGDLAAAFKDTSVASKRPDFSSFLKQGDERIRMLERTESLPDLQKDFTQSQYKVMFRKAKSLTGGDPNQVSRERLRQLLDEMNRMGRRSTGGSGGSGGEAGDWSQDAMEGSEALERGQMNRAMDAMERALSKMRAQEERQQAGGKGLDGGKDKGGRGREGGQGAGSPGDGEGDFGEGGSMPGKGTNPGWRGDPSSRLSQQPLDMGVEGQLRKGRKEAYDTNMYGRGANNPSRLPYMSMFGQYRKQMEDALAKEAIPLDYRTQVRDYFQSLEDR